jgi:uncharacterized protein YbjQ (UPF0145 family)
MNMEMDNWDQDMTQINISDNDLHLKQIEETRYLINQARQSGDWSKIPVEIRDKLFASIILTSSSSVANHRIAEEVEFISAEIPVRLTTGDFGIPSTEKGFSRESTRKLQKDLHWAKQKAKIKLRSQALMLDAGAVIDIKQSHTSVDLGEGQRMILVSLSGTVVKLA